MPDHTHKMSRIGKSLETESRLVGAESLGLGGRNRRLLKGVGFRFGGDENVLELVMIEQLCEYTKNNSLCILNGELHNMLFKMLI